MKAHIKSYSTDVLSNYMVVCVWKKGGGGGGGGRMWNTTKKRQNGGGMGDD